MRKVLFGEEKKTNKHVCGGETLFSKNVTNKKTKRLGKIFQIKGVIRDMTSKWNI